MKKYIIKKERYYNDRDNDITTYSLRSIYHAKNKRYFRGYELKFVEDDIKFVK